MGKYYCKVCKEQIHPHRYSEHMQEYHPEYSFHIVHKKTKVTGYDTLVFLCNTCNISVGGPKHMIEHYQERHPEKL